jgi:alkylation response protein AidB-like acyl-CoA dehydrogenase
MHFDFTEDQQEIKRTARELLAARSTLEAVRKAAESGAYDDGLWRELSELGWPGIAVAEEHGGQGLGMVELAMLLDELGYAIAATPFLSTAVTAAVLQEAGSDEQRARWLPSLASGEATGAVGVARDGVAELVADADGAAVIVLVEDGATRVVARADADVEPVASIDPTRRFGRVRAGGGDALPGDAAAGIDRAAVAVSAELVGVCQRSLDMTLEYVKDRKQFGVPVGSFQAVSHMCAAMLKATEGARSATFFAAWAADAEPERLPEAAAMAKSAAGGAAVEVTGSAIQAHGGIGFTWEADVHWLFKRAQVAAPLYGSAGELRRRAVALAAQRLGAATTA